MGRTYRLAVTRIPHVRPAKTSDFDRLLEIRQRIALRLLQRGIHSNPASLTRAHLEEWTEAGVLWVGEVGGEVVAAVTVWRHDPAGFWPRGDVAAYIRDLMVDPEHASQGYGKVVLGWAERYAAGIGRRRVRLDCDLDNERLMRYYHDAGYREIAHDDQLAYLEKT